MPRSLEIDVVELAASMIRCPSVTPADAGALDVLEASLEMEYALHDPQREGTAHPGISATLHALGGVLRAQVRALLATCQRRRPPAVSVACCCANSGRGRHGPCAGCRLGLADNACSC